MKWARPVTLVVVGGIAVQAVLAPLPLSDLYLDASAALQGTDSRFLAVSVAEIPLRALLIVLAHVELSGWVSFKYSRFFFQGRHAGQTFR